jgi:hypothetical protein
VLGKIYFTCGVLKRVEMSKKYSKVCGMPYYGATLGNGLKLVKSAIPRAGKGLLATRFYPAGVVVTGYGGQFVTKKEMDELIARGHYPWAFVTINKNLYKDGVTRGKHGDLAGQYINDPRNAHVRNIGFCAHKRDIYMYSLVDIYPGEELFTDYGRAYWKAWSDYYHGKQPYVLKAKPRRRRR